VGPLAIKEGYDMSVTRRIGVCVVVVAAMSLAVAAAASAKEVLVLKAHGQRLASGAPFVATSTNFVAQTHVTVNGVTTLQQGECELEAHGTLEYEASTGTWVAAVGREEGGCSGGAWLKELSPELGQLTFSPPQLARSVRGGLFWERLPREIFEESTEQHGPTQPIRCTDVQLTSHGSFPTNGRSPLVTTIETHYELNLREPKNEAGCGLSASSSATFTLTSGGYPIVASLE
jgi:hypothetical protein